MPIIDGCTAARVILAFNPACKVIPMSGSVTDADKYVALAYHAVNHLLRS